MAATAALPQELEPRRLRRRAAQVGLLLALLAARRRPGAGARRGARHARRGGPVVARCWRSGSSCSPACPTCSCSGRCSAAACRGGRAGRSAGPSSPRGRSSPPAAPAAWRSARGCCTAAGCRPTRIARRSVAFFIIKSSVNFVAVAVLGFALAFGLLGPDLSPWLTALPAVLSVIAHRRGPRAAADRRREGPAGREPVPPGLGRGPAQRDRRRGGGGGDRPLARPARDRRAPSATGRSTTRCCGRRSRRSARTCRSR